MRTDVVGKHMDVTEAIRAYAVSKADKLHKYYDQIQSITIRLEAEKKGKFHAEIVIDVEHHDDFVANAVEEDLYASIDMAVDKAHRQLTGFKERLKNSKRESR